MEHEFNIYDQDKDGFLNESEMQAYLKEMQYKTLYN